MNSQWIETAMRLADEYADRQYRSGLSSRQARAALEAHLNTPNADQGDPAKRGSETAALLNAIDAAAREAFEERFSGRPLERVGPHYADTTTDTMWYGWRARAHAETQPSDAKTLEPDEPESKEPR